MLSNFKLGSESKVKKSDLIYII